MEGHTDFIEVFGELMEYSPFRDIGEIETVEDLNRFFDGVDKSAEKMERKKVFRYADGNPKKTFRRRMESAWRRWRNR